MIKKALSHQGFKRYGASAFWLTSEKIIRMAIGLLVGVWVARYLGPEQFGILSYVMAFVGMFAPMGKLGLDGIVSRNIAREEENVTELLSNSAVLKLLGSVLLLITTTFCMTMTKAEPEYALATLLLSAVFVVKSLEVIEFYFRARVRSHTIAIANLVGVLSAAVIKIFFILNELSLVYFALANLLDALISVAIILIFFNKETAKLSIKKVNIKKGYILIGESWPLIFSGFFAVVYLNIDQIMIEEMLNSYHVGQYSAAVRISSAWYFIPMTIGWAIQAAVVNAKKKNETVYHERMQSLFTLMVLAAYVVILPVTFFANEIIDLLYGQEYSDSAIILSLHIWASLFVFVGSIRGLWIMNESHLKFDLLSNLGSAILNVILNYFLIPEFGIVGAAWATLISYSFTYLFSGFLFAPTRKIAIMQLKSIFLLDAVRKIF